MLYKGNALYIFLDHSVSIAQRIKPWTQIFLCVCVSKSYWEYLKTFPLKHSLDSFLRLCILSIVCVYKIWICNMALIPMNILKLSQKVVHLHLVLCIRECGHNGFPACCSYLCLLLCQMLDNGCGRYYSPGIHGKVHVEQSWHLAAQAIASTCNYQSCSWRWHVSNLPARGESC